MKSESGLQGILGYTADADSLWDGQYKIPWDDPGFSLRMLREHLSQDHDLASRRSEMIDAQVGWLHEHICEGVSRHLLDLGCGPGLYLERLAALGHMVCGIDFSPASVEYARKRLLEACRVIQGDLRTVDFGDGYDVAMMVFGELNLFSPEECASILRKAHEALAPGGRLVIEPHTYEAVKSIGAAPNTWYKSESGLFADGPHLCSTESRWIPEQAAALQCFHVIHTDTSEVERHCSTTKAWTNDEYRELLAEAGFVDARVREDWPTHSDALMLWTAKKD